MVRPFSADFLVGIAIRIESKRSGGQHTSTWAARIGFYSISTSKWMNKWSVKGTHDHSADHDARIKQHDIQRAKCHIDGPYLKKALGGRRYIVGVLER